MNLLGLIFDMDGVVVDNNDFHVQAWIATAQQYGLSLTEKKYQQEMNGRTMAACVNVLFGDSTSPEQKRRFGEEKEATYRQLYAPVIKPTPGLPQLLRALMDRNIPIALATSAPPANVAFVLKHTGLGTFFQSIVDDTGVSRGKPDPEIFLTSAQNLGLPARNCIVFEDSLMGIQAAQHADMKVVGVATTLPPEQLTHADAVIDDFTRLTPEQLYQLIA